MAFRHDLNPFKEIWSRSWKGKTYFFATKNKNKYKTPKLKKIKTLKDNFLKEMVEKRSSAIFLQKGQTQDLDNKKSRKLFDGILIWYVNSCKSPYLSHKMLGTLSNCFFQIRRVKRITKRKDFTRLHPFWTDRKIQCTPVLESVGSGERNW